MMMDSAFFGSQWNLPTRTRRYPAARQVPVQRQVPVPTPKVVSIPVHFVESERTSSASAVKIQKVFRGFLVRKNMKRIVAVKREVDEIERRISREEVVDLIRRDSKERLRVNETLMSLLLRLDSVRGVDSGVRDCRKAVIRRAIALQEKVDAIASLDHAIAPKTSDPAAVVIDGSRYEAVDGIQASSADCDGAADETLDTRDSICKYSTNGDFETAPEFPDVSDDCICPENDVDEVLRLRNPLEPLISSGDFRLISKSSLECRADCIDESKDEIDIGESGVGSEINSNAPMEAMEDPGYAGTVSKSTPDRCEDSFDQIKGDADVHKEVEEFQEYMSVTDVGVDSGINSREEASTPQEMVEDPNSALLVNGLSGVERNQEQGEEGQKNGEILKKIVEENEKLMGLMKKLYEKNEAQSRLLCSLWQRVEHLEKAFKCEKLRKKQRQAAAGQDASMKKSVKKL